MPRTIPVLPFFLILILPFTLGCQGSPAVPETECPSELPTSQAQTLAQSHHCLGYFTLAVDTGKLGVQAIPLRSAEWHFNVTGILNGTMGVSAAIVPGESDPPNGLFVLDVTLTHPFATKPQFTGFDVKGILITPGSLPVGPLVFAGADETRLENADGYTRWWNPTEFTQSGILGYTEGNLAFGPTSSLAATVNPYKLFADRLSPEDELAWITDEPLDSDLGRAVFTAGNSNTRRYRIRFPMDPGPQVIYGYAIDCSWNAPSPKPPDEIPDDFPIEANQPEAYRVVLQSTANSLYYDSESGVAGGVLRLQVNVHDWQGQQAGDIPGEVNDVRIFAPDLMSGGIDAGFLNETPIKARYTADLTSLATPTEAGETLIICRVGSSDGSTYQQTGAPAPDSALSSFQVLTVDIPDPECTGDANNDWLEAVEVFFSDPVVDQVCLPDDYRDFFFFELPPGFDPTGEISLYCDAEPTILGLYDDSQTLIEEAAVFGGLAAIPFDALDLLPSTYFLRVLTSNSTQVAPYLLEIAAELENVIPSSPVEVTPEELYVDPNNIWMHENLLFLVGYGGIWVYDKSVPSNPVLLSRSTIYVDGAGCLYYPYFYYTDRVQIGERQVNLVDFSDPYDPVLYENILYFTTDLEDVQINSTHLYVGTSETPDSTIFIYEYAADPLNPVEIDDFTVTGKPQILELMDPEGPETRLVVGTWHDVMSFDVEDPTSVTSTGVYNFPTQAPRDISIDGNYIYTGYVDLSSDGFLYVLYQGMSTITKAGDVDIPGTALYLTMEWPHVYIGGGDAGLTICNVTTPSAPTHVTSINLVSQGLDLVTDDDFVYIIPNSAGLQVVDVSVPLTPVPVSRLEVVNAVYSMELKDGYLLVSEMGSGGYGAIKTLDISDPPGTSIVAEYFPTVQPAEMSLCGDMLAAASFKNWMLFDVTDPLDILQYCSMTESDFVYEIGLYGNAIYVYVSVAGYPVRIYDVSTPDTPHYENTMSFSNSVQDFTFLGDYMYVATGADIEVYSITDPFHPTLVDTYSNTVMGYMETEIHGDYLYLVSDELIEIADISTPASPVFTGSELIPVPSGYGYDFITVEGLFAYVAGHTSAPYSCWIWPPDAPAALGIVYEGNAHSPYDLLAHQGFLYEGSSGDGLHIFDLY